MSAIPNFEASEGPPTCRCTATHRTNLQLPTVIAGNSTSSSEFTVLFTFDGKHMEASSPKWHELEFRPVRWLEDDDYSGTVGPGRMVSQKNQPLAIDLDETPSPDKTSHRISFAGIKGENRKER
jgi:hypothetical protein